MTASLAAAEQDPVLAPALLLPRLVELAAAAGAVILRLRSAGTTTALKADASPVTEADTAAEAVIVQGLRALTPSLPIVAEEAAAAGVVPDATALFWLVDPLDGTSEFVAGRDEFTVNIALIADGRPIAGVVGAPALDTLWWGAAGHGAARRVGDLAGGTVRPIRVRARPAAGLTAIASRSHRESATDAWLAARGITDVLPAGSSLKFCRLAEGAADVYPRFGRTMEWDTAAGHAVLAAAGGRVERTDGGALRYGKAGYENPSFVAWGG